jgi:hypothetical protein
VWQKSHIKNFSMTEVTNISILHNVSAETSLSRSNGGLAVFQTTRTCGRDRWLAVGLYMLAGSFSAILLN